MEELIKTIEEAMEVVDNRLWNGRVVFHRGEFQCTIVMSHWMNYSTTNYLIVNIEKVGRGYAPIASLHIRLCDKEHDVVVHDEKNLPVLWLKALKKDIASFVWRQCRC